MQKLDVIVYSRTDRLIQAEEFYKVIGSVRSLGYRLYGKSI